MNPSADGRERSSPDGSAAFPKNLRLLQRTEFRKVYDQGERRTGSLAAAFCCPNGLDRTRLGITVPAKVGNAVVRNRIKRRVREIFRQERASIAVGWDVILNPREAAARVPFSTLRREILRLFPTRPAEEPRSAERPRTEGSEVR